VWTVAAAAEVESNAAPIVPVARNEPRETKACRVILPSSSDRKSEIFFFSLGNLFSAIYRVVDIWVLFLNLLKLAL
jgi:hypothetical protein